MCREVRPAPRTFLDIASRPSEEQGAQLEQRAGSSMVSEHCTSMTFLSHSGPQLGAQRLLHRYFNDVAQDWGKNPTFIVTAAG